MKTLYKLRMTERQHQYIMRHLFPGDGCEAVTVAVCGVGEHSGRRCRRKVFVVHEIRHVPYGDCSHRSAERVTWSTSTLRDLMQGAVEKGFVVLKIHSHPDGTVQFSELDNHSDSELYESVAGWLQRENSLISAIMLPNGRMFARAWESPSRFRPIESVLVVGDEVSIWFPNEVFHDLDADHFQKRTEQTFGRATTTLLSRLSIGVVGVSGTGSPLVEMLYRLGVGHLVLVDNDVVEGKNVGRIYNSTLRDAARRRYKTDVLARAIKNSRLPTKVTALHTDLYQESTLRRIAQCDMVFGCMDSIDGRDLLNKLSVHYLIPYLDLGVHLEADGEGGVDIVSGAVHYVAPDGPTLLDRKAYTSDRLKASLLKRANPGQYEQLRDEGYIKGVQEDRPAVISINTLIASIAVNDALARLHPYRWFPNGDVKVHRLNVSDACWQYDAGTAGPSSLGRYVGRGDVTPYLREVYVR